MWQSPFALLMLSLVLLPAIPCLVWAFRWLVPTSSQNSAYAQLGRLCSHSVKDRLHRITSEVCKITSGSFIESHWHWHAVLVLQRLLMVAVAVFINGEMGIAIGVTLVALLGMLLQLLVRPYHTKWVNSLQTLACTSLCIITTFNFGSGVFSAVGFDPTGTPLQALQEHLDLAVLLLLFLPPLFFVYKSIPACNPSQQPGSRVGN